MVATTAEVPGDGVVLHVNMPEAAARRRNLIVEERGEEIRTNLRTARAYSFFADTSQHEHGRGGERGRGFPRGRRSLGAGLSFRVRASGAGVCAHLELDEVGECLHTLKRPQPVVGQLEMGEMRVGSEARAAA